MNVEQLLEEGRKLARPCVYLTPKRNGSLAAIWGGDGLIAPDTQNQKFLRHWLSLDCRFLPTGFDLNGCLSLYVDEDGADESGIVAVDFCATLSNLLGSSGIELFAHGEISWPPIDAIFALGSGAVARWLGECDWQKNWPYNSNFRDSEIVAAYEDRLRSQNPLFGAREDVFAMLGGWNEPWPEGDWPDLLAQKLTIFTYRDAEPYVEVWLDENRKFAIIQRIS